MGESSDPASALLDRALFQPYLEPGERILWVGRPGRIRILAPKFWLFPAILFGSVPPITVCGMAFLWVYSWIENGHPVSPHWLIEVTPLIGGSLAAVAVVAVVVTLISRALRIPSLRHTSYAVTSSRAMAINRRKPTTPQSVLLDTVDPFDVTERNDQSGSIAFGYETDRDYDGTEERVPRLLFDEIDNVAFVCALAKDAASKRRPGKRDG